jgi:hypothetical protein
MRGQNTLRGRLSDSAGADWGAIMFQLTQLRFTVCALFAVAAVLLTASSVQAFTLEDIRSGGGSNSPFADSDNQIRNSDRGAQPFGPNGPVVQFGVQQGPSTSFSRFRGNAFSTPAPDPYSLMLRNSGN